MKKLILVMALFSLVFMPLAARAESHGGVKSIEISPVNGEVKAGENLTFTLTAKDNAGLTWDISQNAFFQINDPRGTVEKNIYLAGKIGTWTLSVVYGNYTAGTTVKVIPGDVSSIIVNPNSKPEVIDLGTSKTFSAQAFDKMSNPLSDLTFTWSQEGDLGEINQKGVFSAKDTGEGKIMASLNAVSGSTAIKVKEKTLLPAAVTTTNTNTAKPKTITNNNANDNSNVNGQVAGAEIAAAAEATDSKDECKTFAWYWWVLIMIGFFAVIILYYFFIRKTKGGWWWIFPLILTTAVVWLYYQYSCNKYGWWPWVTIIMAILISLFRPKKYFEEPKTPTF